MDVLNGTDVRGKTVFCFPRRTNDKDELTPSTIFAQASQYIVEGGGSGLIFAQYTTDLLSMTADNCQGIACVLVDLDTGNKIVKYIIGTTYVQSISIKSYACLFNRCFLFSN
jgi:hypothetical protein